MKSRAVRSLAGIRCATPPFTAFIGGLRGHHYPFTSISTVVLLTSRRMCAGGTNNGDGKDKDNSKEPLEHVDGESVQLATGPSSWSGKLLDNEQRGQSRKEAHEAITRLFQDDARRKTLHQQPGRIRSPQSVVSVITATPDEDEDPHNAIHDRLKQTDHTGDSDLALTTVETLEQELLDDAFLYFPPLNRGAIGAEDGKTTAAGDLYVPGQQIVPPGSTRYRVDVQYQGSDFDGWWKSTAHRLVRRETLPDGSTRQVAVHEPSTGGTRAAEMGMKHHARGVLEDALAVALDVSDVKVVAGVIPEVGVSVRRLCCHVDLPSFIEMQPRTIIQRATMWLEKRQQPLAILSCQRCLNQDFHARHSGLRRVYVYRILNRVAPPLFDAGLQWHVDRYLNVDRMQRFAKEMEGTMDYGYFADPKMANALRRAAVSSTGLSTGVELDEHYSPTAGKVMRAPKVNMEKGLGNLDRAAALPTFDHYGQRVVQPGSHAREYYRAATNLPTIRTIDRIDVVRQDDEVLIWFVGKSFLRHQIRNMVSVLKAVGHGLWDELELRQALQSGFEPSRKKFNRERFPAAPVFGLTLWDVEYPSQHRDDYVPFVDSGPYEEVNIVQDL